MKAMVTVSKDDILHVMKNSNDWLPGTISNDTQRSMMHQPGIRELERLGETNFRHTVDSRDVRDGHPGAYQAHIPVHDTLVILFKLLVSSDSACSREHHTDQCHSEKKTDTQKFYLCPQISLLSLRKTWSKGPLDILT